MTIKVEQETLIALQSQSWPISNENDDYILRLPRKESYRVASHEYNSPLVDKSLCTHSTDDEDSVYTESTASFSDADSDFDRRVSFADDLVTDMWTRPFTEKDEISNLYYSNDETIRFRQEYRMERKLLSTLTSDFAIDAVDKEDLSTMIESTCSSPSVRHRNGISRVVVLHNDRLETFCSAAEVPSTSASPCSLSGKNGPDNDVPSDFFDTPEFWSGSITWW